MSRDLLLVCFACVLVRLPWMFLVPVGEAPDENTHYWVIDFMRRHLRLPGAGEVAAAGPAGVYGSLPQLGYLPHVAMSMLFCWSNPVLFARFGSLFMGLVAVWAAFRTGQTIFAGNRLLVLALPGLLVFHPQFVFVNSYANNDATAAALGSVVIYLSVVTVKSGLSFTRTAAAGLLCGWLFLSKYAGAVLMPVAALAIASAAWLGAAGPAAAAAHLALFAACGLPLPAWWLVRNAGQYPGDPLGTATMYRTWAEAYHRQLDYRISPLAVVLSRRWWRFMFFSFWGIFGYMNRYLWRPVYFVYLGFLLAAAYGWARAAAARLWRGEGPANLCVWLVLCLALAGNLAAMIWASTVNLGGPQGRYLFVSELPAAALLLGGLARFGPRAQKWLALAFLAFNAAVTVGAWIMLVRLYGFPARLG